MRVLITGARGFVGPYVAKAIEDEVGSKAEIIRSSISRGSKTSNDDILDLDVTNFQSVLRQLERLRPTHVIHLAGLAAIPFATANSEITWRVHLLGTLNVANAMLQTVPDSVLVYVGSGQVYGSSANRVALLTESDLLAPTNPYEASKAAADIALGALTSDGLRTIRLRPFNHTGPGQSEQFVVPNFAMQIARIKLGQQEPILRVGNLSAERDFLDVRDVARAYAMAVARANSIANGTILNIASGVGISIHHILTELIKRSGVGIEIETDPARLRRVDIPRFVGDASLARELLGWQPRIAMDRTLDDLSCFSEAAIVKQLSVCC